MENSVHNCPTCAQAMHTVRAVSTYGAQVVLEQCDRCGGLWCDDLEAYRVKIGEAENIEKVDAGKLRRSTVFAERGLRCPKDKEILIQFRDLNFPKELDIESCPTCGGFWFNRGEFAEFQEERKKKIEAQEPVRSEVPAEDKEFGEKIGMMLAAGSNGDASDTMASVARFLSTPIDPLTRRPIGLPSENGRRAQGTIDAASGILQIILRLMLP